MGLDAQISLFEPYNQSYDLEALREKFDKVFYWKDEFGYPYLDKLGVVQTLYRYYNIGYERGPWPEIKYWIDWLRYSTDDSPVCYSSDSTASEDAYPITKEEVEKIDLWFMENGNQPYIKK